ncbi:MAG: sugar ABC transporter permease [Candidatus Omnitrophica bacterium]|nr:sugar ABC transporter permease [Candidatus Omnitrophota bacterium]
MKNKTFDKFSFLKFKDATENYFFIFPALAIFAVFYIYPFFEIFNLSLHEWNGISLTRDFIGISNFKEIMQDKVWWSSMWHAGYITLIALTLQNMLAFALALSCDRDIRMRKFYRVVFYLPPVLSEIVVGLIWQWILNSGMQSGQPIGLLNYFLTKVHLNHLVHHWLSDPKTALTCIAVVHSWKGFGWGFIILLAGLQTIDRQLYEAAYVDGAGAFSTFKNITVPMMIPVFVMVMILTILGSMQVFVLVLSMVGQGLVYHTEVPVTRILSSMTGASRFGYACAQGIVFGLILMMSAFILNKISKKAKQ